MNIFTRVGILLGLINSLIGNFPQTVLERNIAIAISTKDNFTCVVSAEEQIWCWPGVNYLPTKIEGTNKAKFITTSSIDYAQTSSGYSFPVRSDHVCYVTEMKNVQCWGGNEHGQLGDGARVSSLSPVDVVGVYDVMAISANGGHTCAVTHVGSVMCWGDNSSGQLGNYTTETFRIDQSDNGQIPLYISSTPVNVLGLDKDIIAISAGPDRTCAVTNFGVVKCWGRNFNGALGTTKILSSTEPLQISGLSGKAIDIAVGASHTCALIEDRSVECWGSNGEGQLGDGTISVSTLPVKVIGLSGVTKLVAGGRHNCVLVGSKAKCWGNNEFGQLGNGTTRQGLYLGGSLPADVLIDDDVVSISAWVDETCLVTRFGGAKCFGKGYKGALGNGIVGDQYHYSSTLPVDVIGFNGFVPNTSNYLPVVIH